MMSCNGKIAVFKNKRDSIEVAVYDDELTAVRAMVNNGSLGARGGYGSDSHKEALYNLSLWVGEVLATIAEQEATEQQS